MQSFHFSNKNKIKFSDCSISKLNSRALKQTFVDCQSNSPSPATEMNGQPVPVSPPIRDLCNISPRSTMEIDRVGDNKKKDAKHQHKSIPKAPTIKKVSFSTSENITKTTERAETTIKTDHDSYYVCDQEDEAEQDYDDDDEQMEDDYDDEDEEAEHDYDEEDDLLTNPSGDDLNDDLITTKSPTGVAEASPTAKTIAVKNAMRRKIRWSSQVRVQEIRHLNNISETERDAVWMSPVDYKLIKNMAKTTVLMMMAGEYIDDEDPDFCTRGLEFRTRKGSKIRSGNKLRARSAVLNEQDLQREEGFHDPEFIAMAALDVSYECREQAKKRGEQDAQSISNYLSDVREAVNVVFF